MTIQVTVTDTETGDTETKEIPTGDYVIICAEPCHIANLAAYANGTHQLTIKGRKPGL